jgi:uncharacterized protein YecT (DUF1311 family)
MRSSCWLVIVGLVSCGGSAQHGAATVAAESETIVVCLDTAMTTFAMQECYRAPLESTDRRIAQLLDSARRTVASPAAVDSAQAAWLIYRTAQCHAEGAEFAGGTMESLATVGCRLSLNEERVKVLEGQLSALVR